MSAAVAAGLFAVLCLTLVAVSSGQMASWSAANSLHSNYTLAEHSATWTSADTGYIIGGLTAVETVITPTVISSWVLRLTVTPGSSAASVEQCDLHSSSAAFRARKGHSAVLQSAAAGLDGRILVWGGYDGAYLADAWTLQVSASTVRWREITQSGLAPAARQWHTCNALCVPERRMATPHLQPFSMFDSTDCESGSGVAYMACYGGETEGGDASADFDHMRLSSHTWAGATFSGGSSLPAPRSRHTAVTFNSHVERGKQCLAVFAGLADGGTNILSDLWLACPVLADVAEGAAYNWDGTWSWTEMSPNGTLPIQRHSHVASMLAGRMFMFGGFSGEIDNDYMQDAHLYDPVTNSWRSLSAANQPPTPRMSAALVATADSSSLAATAYVLCGRDRYESLAEIHVATWSVNAPTAGSHSITGLTDAAVQCEAGYYSGNGAYNCTACSPGQYQQATGQSGCDSCGAGRYSTAEAATSSATCVLCSAGYMSTAVGATSSATCTQCGGGTRSSSDRTSCDDCPVGTYAAAGSNSCTDCAAGSYTNAEVTTTCDLCPAGQHQPDKGKTTCYNCPAGHYSDEGSDHCVSCPLGTQRPSIAGAGLSACVDCLPGYYAALRGTVQCTACPAGTAHNQARATSVATCVPCNPGFYAPAGSSQCLPCPAGSYSNTTGLATCIQCPKGSYSTVPAAISSDTCILCDIGKTTDAAGADELADCVACPAGYFNSNTTSTCLPCPPGTTSMEAERINQCSPCASDFYAPDHGSPACLPCPANSYSYRGWSRCSPCSHDSTCKVGPNNVVCSGHGSCIFGSCVCDSGWSGVDCSVGTCETCFGVFQINVAGSSNALLVENEQVTVEVTREVGSQGAVSVDLEINFDEPNVTASGSDMSPSFPLTLEFADGETSKSFTLTALNDWQVDEGCEMVLFELMGESGGASLGTNYRLTLQIEDVDVTPYMTAQTADSVLNPTSASIVVGDIGESYYHLNVSVSVPITAVTPLDLVIVEDLSQSFYDDLGRLSALTANLAARIQAANADVYFGVTSFVDTPCCGFGESDEWGYKLHLKLTPNAATMQDVIDSLSVKYGTDLPEAQLMGLLMTARRTEEVGWRAGSRKVAVLATDADFHVAGDGTLHGLTANNGDGVFDGGDGAEDYPSVAQIRTALKEAGIVPIFAVTSGVVAQYQALVESIGFGTVVQLAGDSSNAVEAIMTGLDDIQNAISLQVVSDVDARIDSIQPALYSNVVGQTVYFDVSILGCHSSQCARDAVSAVQLTVPLYGTVDLQLIQSVDVCTAVVEPVVVQTLGWMGWVQPDRSGTAGIGTGLAAAFTGSGDADGAGQVPWWIASDSTKVVLEAVPAVSAPSTLEVINSELHLTRNSAAEPAVTATQTLTLTLTNTMPLVLRGFSRADSMTATAPTDYSVSVSATMVDGSVMTDAAILSFSAGTYDYEVKYALFAPTSVVASLTLTAVLQGDATGDAWFAGLGVLAIPEAACVCEDGYYASISATAFSSGVSLDTVADAVQCVRCPLASACTGGAKMACPEGQYSYGGFSVCLDCPAGRSCTNGTIARCGSTQYVDENGHCVDCPSGSSCSSGKVTGCRVGFYAPEANSAYCLPCLPGTMSNVTSATGCIACPAGWTSNHGRWACVTCGFGETSTEGQHPCSSCEPGYYAPARGSAECKPCPLGTYTASQAARQCMACPDATPTTASTASTSISDCIAVAPP